MLGTIIWIAGVVCAIWCVLDILKQPISLVGKIIASVLVLITSWIGIAVYYFFARKFLPIWFR